MLKLIQHPYLLVLAMLICIPLLFSLGRFFFDDFETFKQEVGLGNDFDRSLWLLGCIPSNPILYFKIIGFFGIYSGATAAVYQLLTKIF
jgi:hypothetical protein